MPSNSSGKPGTCRPGFVERAGSCYLVDGARKPFFKAAEWCEAKGAELVSIHGDEENAGASAVCGNRMCWIGLTEVGGDFSTPKDLQTWKWEDGSLLKYANWQPGEPNNYGGNDEKFAFMNLDVKEAPMLPKLFSGKWFDGPEHMLAHALCKDAGGVNASQLSPTNLIASQSRSVYTLLPGKFSAREAQTACGAGKRMAMPKTSKQVRTVFNLLRVAGEEFSPEAGVMLGGHETRDGSWIWNDGTSIADELWFPGQPSDNVGAETQLCTWAAFQGKFHDCPAEGLWGTLRVICEPGRSPAPVSTESTAQNVSTAKTDFMSCRGGCFLVDEARKDYFKALAWCRSQKAELVSIHGAAENELAREACGHRMCWIGLTERGGTSSTTKAEQDWRWEDGKRMAFTNWQPGEPNNYEGNDERYAFMNLDIKEVPEMPRLFSGRWFDGPEWVKAHALCRIPVPNFDRGPSSWILSGWLLSSGWRTIVPLLIIWIVCRFHTSSRERARSCWLHMLGYKAVPIQKEPTATELGKAQSQYTPPNFA